MNRKKIKKHPLFLSVFGQETSLRFRIAKAGWTYIECKWQRARWLARKLPWMLAGRNARMRIGKSTMEIPVDMLWAFAHGDYSYESNVSYWLEKILLGTKNRVFFDVGANYGYYCLKFADSASQIYAFEPVSRTYDILLKNILNNNLTNIIAYKLGLLDKKSSMEINICRESGHNSLFLSQAFKNELVGQEVVSLVPLDVLIQAEKLNPPDLIKIDIEGEELYALKGARETIKKHRPALVIEYIESQFKDAGYSRSDLLAELNIKDYIIYGIPANVRDLNVYPLIECDDIEINNIIALPKGMEGLIKPHQECGNTYAQ